MQSEQALQVQALQTRIDSKLIRLDWSDNESVTKTRSILISSLRWSMNRTSNATCVVSRNRNSESATMTRERLILSLSSSLDSESAWTTFKIKFSHESFFICIFYDLSLFTTLTTTARWYVLRTEWNIHHMSQDREWNIYYMSEITKIWAETRSSLNIWSWIERVCLNDKNSESASMTHSIVSLLQRHESILDWSDSIDQKWVCYKDR